MMKKIYDEGKWTGYYVTEDGRILSVKNPRAPGSVLPMTPFRSSGKRCVELRVNDSERYARAVDRLVASAYVANPNGYNYVRHIDGNEDNVAANNLVWRPHLCRSCQRIFPDRASMERECAYCLQYKQQTIHERVNRERLEACERFGLYRLTGVYRSIVQMMLDGCSVNDIAETLMMSVQYVYKIQRKVADGKVLNKHLVPLSTAQLAAAQIANEQLIARRDIRLSPTERREIDKALQMALFDLESLGSETIPELDEFVQSAWDELEHDTHGFELLV